MAKDAEQAREEKVSSSITTVTFDLWQTLLLDHPEVGRSRTQSRLRGAQSALTVAGEEFTYDQVEAGYWKGIRQCQEIREFHLDITFSRQIEIFVDCISPGLADRLSQQTLQEISLCYADSFFEHPARPHPDGINVLRSVKDMGLRMGMVSNTGMTPGVSFRRFLSDHGMVDFFEVLTFSDEVGICKPSCEIFNMTLRALGALPSQAIHVGDQIFNDIAAAKACGLATIWIEGFSERPDLTDQATESDASVSSLREVPTAIRELLGRTGPT